MLLHRPKSFYILTSDTYLKKEIEMVGFEPDEREKTIRKEILLIIMNVFKQNNNNLNRKSRKARCENGRTRSG